jgi:hypothetical protein
MAMNKIEIHPMCKRLMDFAGFSIQMATLVLLALTIVFVALFAVGLHHQFPTTASVLLIIYGIVVAILFGTFALWVAIFTYYYVKPKFSLRGLVLTTLYIGGVMTAVTKSSEGYRLAIVLAGIAIWIGYFAATRKKAEPTRNVWLRNRSENLPPATPSSGEGTRE